MLSSFLSGDLVIGDCKYISDDWQELLSVILIRKIKAPPIDLPPTVGRKTNPGDERLAGGVGLILNSLTNINQ